MGKFVCAFRGRRDSYQVPLALAEAGLLDQFITDAYALPWVKTLAKLGPQSVRAKVSFRSEPDLPVALVRCLWGTTLVEHLRHRLGCAPTMTFNKLDRHFSRAAARRAAQNKTHLFLYSPYAWEAFTTRYPHTPRKILFQYHPHSELESRILAEDRVRYPKVGEPSVRGAIPRWPEKFVRRERDCWKHADLIFCASSFTKRSLVEAGCDEGRTCVVPYGVELPAAVEAEPIADLFHVLFVGSGGQRKGLHHLLLAWQKAKLPASSKLTLACRVIDRGIEQLLQETPRVEFHQNATQVELHQLYARSSLFAMPSLAEGFGQVYLEALAHGCPVLGTPNTGLPDIGGEANGIFLVTPGQIDELVAKLESLAGFLPNNHAIRARARACAAKFTWPLFREALRQRLARSAKTF
jgi:glycosyltransferase involved in cell wall biosynthesis